MPKRSAFWQKQEEDRVGTLRSEIGKFSDQDLEAYRQDFNKVINSGEADSLDWNKKDIINEEVRRRKEKANPYLGIKP
jgi:hypothetical protein